MARRIGARWFRSDKGGLTLELHIPMQPYAPDARHSEWTQEQLTHIAELTARVAETAIKAVEEVGL